MPKQIIPFEMEYFMFDEIHSKAYVKMMNEKNYSETDNNKEKEKRKLHT